MREVGISTMRTELAVSIAKCGRFDLYYFKRLILLEIIMAGSLYDIPCLLWYN